MTTVKVEVSGSYCVDIGAGLLEELGVRALEVAKGTAAVIVSDDTVNALYGDRAETALVRSGFSVCRFVFPHGEASKNGTTYLNLLQFLAEHSITRSDLLVALGGGVTGDLTGFAAATFLRGIRFVQVPTTLLAAVDSSVGGKTGIDLPAGKNLAGAFYQPKRVVCDYETLRTLPPDIFADGCAEVIKYSILGSPELYDHLLEKGADFDTEAVIAQCVAMKRDVVRDDEFDTGRRQLLNLGHTIAHGIEACSHYEISHGRAVAMGMAIIARAAARKGYCTAECAEAIERVIRRFGLPVETEYSAAALTQWALSDKKRAGNRITLVVPRKIGHCDLVKIPVSELQDWMEAGLPL
ncbi:MAG: 3-dehydroquinate synthase [Clostridia bacterium]|nr:3-dehydroquinate synthase [Clostridia bacterium]